MFPSALGAPGPQDVAAILAEPGIERTFIDAGSEHGVAEENVIGFFCVDLAEDLPVKGQLAQQRGTIEGGQGENEGQRRDDHAGSKRPVGAPSGTFFLLIDDRGSFVDINHISIRLAAGPASQKRQT